MAVPARPNLLQCLINASEKASNIARVCHTNKQLLQLLVQEKTVDANLRFEHDFKTLADVLIQETIKHDVGAVFPELKNAIKGEESANFTNKLGESTSVVVGKTESETTSCLSMVLEGYEDAAIALSTEVHRNVVYTAAQLGDIPDMPANLDYSKLGIWIDPIDATAEYISGNNVFTHFPGISSTGLGCVTVLIGVYDRSNGLPLLGIISQPFHTKIDDIHHESLVFWGVALPNLCANNCSVQNPVSKSHLAIFSSSENADILDCVRKLGYEVVFSAGAGHKALKVITSDVDLYILSKGSTFKWDTCAPQAILRSMGGDMLDFVRSISEGCPVALSYLENSAGNLNTDVCNKGGLIAVRDLSSIEKLLENFASLPKKA